MTRRHTILACAVVVAGGLGYAAVSAQTRATANGSTVTVFKSPT